MTPPTPHDGCMRTDPPAGERRHPEPECATAHAAHGVQCSCRLLCAAARADGNSITFNFCARFLSRRWALRCDHGGAAVTTWTPAWRDAEPLSGVDAILISNS